MSGSPESDVAEGAGALLGGGRRGKCWTPAQPCPPGAPETAQGSYLSPLAPPPGSVSVLSPASAPGSALRMLEVALAD